MQGTLDSHTGETGWHEDLHRLLRGETPAHEVLDCKKEVIMDVLQDVLYCGGVRAPEEVVDAAHISGAPQQGVLVLGMAQGRNLSQQGAGLGCLCPPRTALGRCPRHCAG